MKNVKPFNKFINEEIGDPNWLDKSAGEATESQINFLHNLIESLTEVKDQIDRDGFITNANKNWLTELQSLHQLQP